MDKAAKQEESFFGTGTIPGKVRVSTEGQTSFFSGKQTTSYFTSNNESPEKKNHKKALAFALFKAKVWRLEELGFVCVRSSCWALLNPNCMNVLWLKSLNSDLGLILNRG